MKTHFHDKHLRFAEIVNSLADQISFDPGIRSHFSPMTLAIADSVLHARKSRALPGADGNEPIKHRPIQAKTS
jgi:hypothetical protein